METERRLLRLVRPYWGLLAAGLVITFLGAFFRGPGYAFTLPWENGLWFAL